MRFIYDFAFLIFALISIPKFLARLKQAKNSGELIRERFGIFSSEFKDRLNGRNVVWLHAVSVGEVLAARPWMELFGSEYPNWKLALSVTTPTGRSVAERFASEHVAIFYAPFDLSFVTRRFLDVVRPRLVLLMETEIWPNLISEANSRRIPIGIMNGRISRRSFRRYRLIRPWIASVLRQLEFCLVQSDRDRDYFKRLGMPPSRIVRTGNLKFDRTDPVNESELKDHFLCANGMEANGPVWVAGSTSWNEEEWVVRVFRRLREKFGNLKLILAPRHPEQISKVVACLRRYQIRFRLLSQNDSAPSCPVLLVDQMGILQSLYSKADVVFVGGSLVKRGGQNPIEASLFKKPLIHGPHVFNFSEIYGMLDANGAAFQISTEEGLYEKLDMLLDRPEVREKTGERAWSTIQSMKGAAVRTMAYLERWIQAEKESHRTAYSYDPTTSFFCRFF